MATVERHEDRLTVRFGRWEPLFTGRGRVDVPIGALREAECVEEPRRATRGGRSGLLVTGLVKIGRWGVGVGLRQLVSVRRGVPALRLVLDRNATGYDEVLVSVPDAAGLAAGLSASRT